MNESTSLKGSVCNFFSTIYFSKVLNKIFSIYYYNMDVSTRRNLFAFLVFYMVTDLTVTFTLHKQVEDNNVVGAVQSALECKNILPVFAGGVAAWYLY